MSDTDINYDKDQKTYYFFCPHCNILIAVPTKDIKCTRFCHGNFKKGLKPISPYTTKDESERLLKEDLIYGCGKPFIFDGRKVIKRDTHFK